MRRSGSARKSRSSSSRSIFSGTSSAGKKTSSRKGTSFFAKKRPKSASKARSGKTYRAEEKKERFVKPPHDPGPKIRPEGVEVEEYSVEEGGNVVQQALQNRGCGCCGSITSFFWFLGIGGMIAFIILVVKCGGC